MGEFYLTPASAVTASIEVKRSVFRCDLQPVTSEEDARQAIEAARRTHWDARHHCSAFVLGPRSDVRRSNDDGEPSGTAGRPILDVLLGAEFTDVVAVVTRWFGGTLLGTGGLVKAYGDATREAVARASAQRVELRHVLRTEVAMNDVGRVEHALRAAGHTVLDVDYTHGAGTSARVEVGVASADVAVADSLLAGLTGGLSTFTQIDTLWTKV